MLSVALSVYKIDVELEILYTYITYMSTQPNRSKKRVTSQVNTAIQKIAWPVSNWNGWYGV
jgi:hypothetical protein